MTPSKMNLYRIQFDGLPYWVEAPFYGAAISAWKRWGRQHWGDEWDGDEEPESVEHIHDEPVIRWTAES